ncbi:MAG: hypothetical protein RSD42_06305, partial [Oscillospiraceae bacterium]
ALALTQPNDLPYDFRQMTQERVIHRQEVSAHSKRRLSENLQKSVFLSVTVFKVRIFLCYCHYINKNEDCQHYSSL